MAGYQSGLVTAERAEALHLNYGFNFDDVLRLEVRGDAVWANDRATDLDNELLAGLGFSGTVMGPWQTIVNFDLGVPVAGPADDFTIFIAFLKLFN
ncbi:MAG: hypothetical protein ACC742_06490 [Thermoanaerobaculales bacterium]